MCLSRGKGIRKKVIYACNGDWAVGNKRYAWSPRGQDEVPAEPPIESRAFGNSLVLLLQFAVPIMATTWGHKDIVPHRYFRTVGHFNHRHCSSETESIDDAPKRLNVTQPCAGRRDVR